MKKCPYCGSDVSSEAQFCTACMRSLVEKRDVTPKIRNIRSRIVFSLCFLVTAAVVGTVFLLNMGEQSGADGSAESVYAAVTEPETEGPEPESPIASLMRLATYLTGVEGCSDYWSPHEYVHTHTLTDREGMEWMIYNIPLKIEGAVMRTFMCRDGRVITTIGGLSDDTLDKGEKLSMLMAVATYTERYDISDEAREAVLGAQITESEAEEAALTELGLPDYAAGDYTGEQTILRKTFRIGDHGDYNSQLMTVDTRTATVEDRTVYDVTVIHSFE